MVASDRTNFEAPMPGTPSVSHDSAMAGPGSAATNLPQTSGPLGDRIQQGSVGNSAVVYGPYDSLATADVVTVGPLDTMVPAEADQYQGQDVDALSGISGDAVGHSGAGAGRVVGDVHPGRH